jgi:hypothetical protein
MRVLNISKEFAVGKSIVAIKEFINGSVVISVGDQGVIEKITIESFPDFGLYNIRVLHMKFGEHELGLGEQLAESFFNVI